MKFIYSILILLINTSVVFSFQNPVDSLKRILSASTGAKRIEILNQLSKEYLYTDPATSIKLCAEAISLNEKENEILAGIDSYNNLAKAYNAIGNYDTAIKIFNKAILLNPNLDIKLLAESYNGKGTTWFYKGNLKNAIEYFIEAAGYYQQSGNKKGEAQMMNNIGVIYSNMENYEKALEYYKKSLKIHEESNYIEGIASCFNNIGNIYSAQKKYNEALKNYEKALEGKIKLNEKKAIAGIYQNIGNIYEYQNNLEKAISFYRNALSLASEIENKQLIASSYYNIGNIYKKTKLSSEAIEFYTKSLEIAKFIGAETIEMNDSKNLSELYSESGNFEKALYFSSNYSKLKDSLQSEENKRKIHEIQVNYETLQKEKEIELLQKDIELKKTDAEQQKFIFLISILIIIIIAISIIFILYYIRAKEHRKNQELKQELNSYMQKALSQQMNPHFIFNTLNSIQFYILQNDNHSSNKYLSKFAKLMRMTLDNSLKEHISIREEIDALNLYLELESLRFEEKFEYFVNVDPELFNYQIPPLLIQPFAENAIWHGLMHKPGKGKIEIELKLFENKIHCRIEDNGIGRSKAKEIKENKEKTHVSHGSRITENRLKLINSLFGSNFSIQYKDLADIKGNACGTRVEIVLPVIS